MEKRTRIWVWVSVLLLVTLACGAPLKETPTLATPTSPVEQATVTMQSPLPTDTAAPTVEPGVQVEVDNAYAPAFAKYQAVTVQLPQSFANDYTLPLQLADVKGMDFVELSDAQKQKLGQNGFVVAPPEPDQYREFYQLYEQIRYYDVPVFVTTDAVFHVYHLLFNKMLRDLERDYFIPDLEQMTAALLDASVQQYQALLTSPELRGTPMEDAALRNVAYFGVAARLLELPNQPPAGADALIQAELALIEAHAGVAVSPIWDIPGLKSDEKLIEDYSQYVPRGHYTRSDALKRYFKAMMWYGRMTFRLVNDFETRRALLVTQALRTATAADGRTALQLWQNIYEPTTFIVGKADDLSYFEYAAISDVVFGADAAPTDFADEVKFATFKKATETLPPPQVNSMWVWIWQDTEQVTKGFRMMGQRFTLDAYVFGQVMWRKVGTLENPRDLPKGLDFFASMGSAEALSILDTMGETKYENYSTQMDKVRNQVASLEMDSWTQNLYWSWLYSFQPLITVKDERYPAFMRSQAWQRKELNTALSSWTELKHDTILYAKQVMAEMGGGSENEPPRGYVEPNPEVYARLLALAQMTRDGLQSRNLLSDITRGNLENLIDTLTFLKSASERELAGEPLTAEEYNRIMYFGGTLEMFTLMAADRGDDGSNRDLNDQRAALIADVATGIGRVLEEGVGQPTRIYVVLPDQPWRVAVGGVFTYYEFTVPSDGRLTDEQWWQMVEGGQAPAAPDWTASFMTP
jgi:hypothetical protein